MSHIIANVSKNNVLKFPGFVNHENENLDALNLVLSKHTGCSKKFIIYFK